RLLSKGMSRHWAMGPLTVSALLGSPVAEALASNEVGPAEEGDQMNGPIVVWPPAGMGAPAPSRAVVKGAQAVGQSRPLAGSAWKSLTDASAADPVPRFRNRT